ncbi:8-amino-7-oxononanoate synthase [Pedobacter sp. SYP-B3415]|uniref:aminotransferase class I/II-fold pyridoxal phosphate-dependent enzyme n=1 Tax=Pedobacter sp. SYP-B3415 TaxID=2496641 RepID=UPI00101BF91E|nr:8-amino-7-oxononanoate synthase [Pedobacter sp. SYP-B3415]
MNNIQRFIESQLADRREKGLLRQLNASKLPYDFCSNDYLGFARSTAIAQKVVELLSEFQPYLNGSGGSRLLSGNHPFTESTEAYIAGFHGFESALLFNSGYDANVGLLSSLPQKGDTVITDELIHASLIDGIRLSHANRLRFAHNNTEALAERLQRAVGKCYVVVESIYSMDGDAAPLQEIASVCRQYNAGLIVDEAHAIGIKGRAGRGVVAELGLQQQVLACVYTYGKALGTHGAAICGNSSLRDYLLNFARSFIYSTAAAPHTIASIHAAYLHLEHGNYSELLKNRTALFDNLLQDFISPPPPADAAIRSVICPGNFEAKTTAARLQSAGFDVRAILSPTVASGTERLRICLHTFNTDEEINALVKHLREGLKKN